MWCAMVGVDSTCYFMPEVASYKEYHYSACIRQQSFLAVYITGLFSFLPG